MKNSKRKGESFAEKIYKHYRNLFKDTHIFVKETMASGATDEPADIFIVFPDNTKLVIECKHWKTISLSDLKRFYTKLIESKYLQQSDIPLIIYKENYRPVRVYIDLSNILKLISADVDDVSAYKFQIILFREDFDNILLKKARVTK